MNGGLVVREARRRAGITQRQLAARLGTHQSVVARWEALQTSPAFDAVCAACAACGYDLDWQLRLHDVDTERVLHEQRRRSPAARVASVTNLAALRRGRA
ncbi:MAG TPA: helix-turn-helix transcriptional regulator [Candidatus Dormibacteraeota bacterium]